VTSDFFDKQELNFDLVLLNFPQLVSNIHDMHCIKSCFRLVSSRSCKAGHFQNRCTTLFWCPRRSEHGLATAANAVRANSVKFTTSQKNTVPHSKRRFNQKCGSLC